MKVLVVNPWVGNIANYTHGFCEGLANYCDVTLITNYYDENESDNYRIIKSFFKQSDKMERGTIRKVVRGLEYIKTYQQIMNMVEKENYDIVHFQWLLIYRLDIEYIHKLKQNCKVVLTAHNVLPHVKGERFIKQLDDIYEAVDGIFVHGENIKKEFNKYFPKYTDKIRIQYHGDMMCQNTQFDKNDISPELQKRISHSNKVYIFFGNIFFNKGTDILLKTWIDHFQNSQSLLIIAGRKTEPFAEFDDLCSNAENASNILIFNHYVEDNLLNYLVSSSDIIVLPYRHASMSGVVFTAAQFKKPIVCTEAGSITEYVREGQECFVCSATEDSVYTTIRLIEEKYDKQALSKMGENLFQHIHGDYSWSEIGKKVSQEYYSGIL